MGWVCGISGAEVDSTGHWPATLLLHFHLQGLGLGDDLQVGAAHGWLHVLTEHVCPLPAFLSHLELSISFLHLCMQPLATYLEASHS